MKKKKKKRERVPNVLWKQFNNRAASLSSTIISLIPKTCICNCNCNSKGKCLRCVFGNDDDASMSYLIRPDDPSEYRHLMSTCFVVVPHDAPPISPKTSFTLHSSQLQIVERTIQASLRKDATSNAICHGYQKFKLQSNNVKVLTSWPWELALQRVGDSVMHYLLMHTLIFMPINCNAHNQVVGPLVNQLFARSPMHIAPDDCGSSLHSRHQRKRKRCNGPILNFEGPASQMPVRAGLQNSTSSVGSKYEDDIGTQCPEMSIVMSENCSSGQHVTEEQIIEKLEAKPGKRVRLPSWQRRKRRKKLMLQYLGTQESSRKVLNEEDGVLKTYRHGLANDRCQGLAAPTLKQNIDYQNGVDLKSEQPMQLCPCCSVFQSLSRIPKDTEIGRRHMLYSSESSSSLFLKKHVFYSLKSGFAGVNDLFLHIFGLPNTATRNLPASCFHKHGRCSHGSSCLYHSLIKLLRVFLHRAKRCRHKVLLDKHCPSQPLCQLGGDGDGDGDGDRDVQSNLQPRKMESGLLSSKLNVNQGSEQDTKFSRTKTRARVRTTEVFPNQFGLNRPYCLKDEVVAFVWAVCRSVVPPDLLGSPSSCRTLRRNISRFTRLRRYEKFSMKQCLHKLDASRFPLLSNTESFKCCNSVACKPQAKQIPWIQPNSQESRHSAIKQMLLERWIFWFFSHIVVPLIQTNFYVTESENSKQNLFFYRKSIWEKLSGRVTTCLEDENYRSLDVSSVAEILSKRSFGFSKVRLCPKENGARPVANLKAPSKFCTKRPLSHARGREHIRYVPLLKPVNTVLRDLHVIFKDLKVKEPARWGSTVFSYNDVHKELCSFLRQLKDGQPTMPTVYIVVSDVQKAFDTIKQDKLLSILNEIQMTETYSMQKSCEIFYTKKSPCTSENLKMVIQGSYSGLTGADPPVCQKHCQTIVVNQEQSITIRREKLKFILKEHVEKNVIQLGQCFYLQTVGIPQGSVLSTLLCTLYYGHMERHVIYPYLAKSAHDLLAQAGNEAGCSVLEATPDVSFSSPKYLLLRFIDDFLFVSTSIKQATSFFSRLQRGFREYNCFMNMNKFCMNFDSGGAHKLDSNRLLVGSDGASFLKWSGLLINSRSLEVQADYSRYLGCYLSSTLTVNWQYRPGCHLRTKLYAYIRNKCHPVFFDSRINSPATIMLNVYQAFVVCAMKFHCHVRQLSIWCKLQPGSCLSSIEKSLRYKYKLMSRMMHKVQCESDCQQRLEVGRKQVIWLGLTAYIRVLSKRKSRHSKLLQLLKTKLAGISSVGNSAELKYVVNDSHSSYLWKIKY